MRWDGRNIVGPAQVQFRLHPSPRVHWRFACNDAALALQFPTDDDFVTPALTSVPVPGTGRLWGPSSPGEQYRVSVDNRLSVREYGDPSALHRVVIGVLNFTANVHRWAHNGGEESRQSIPMDFGPWRITMLGRLTELARNGWWRRDEGDSAMTHAIDVRRADGATFTAADIEPLRDALFHVLGFANGSLVGLALPMGYGANDEPIWIRWDQTVSEGLCSRLTWFDPNAAHDLGPLVEGYMALATDVFWSQLLRRTFRMHATANQPQPIDQAIPIAMSGLELLAWVHKKVAPPIKSKPGKPTTADFIRGLLRWTNISTTVASELTHLQAFGTKPSRDFPGALSEVRNRLIHPPKTQGPKAWPDIDLLIDTWRGAMESLDLVLLKVLGHHGNYVHRRHLTGHYDGDTTPVPWPSPPPPATTPAPPKRPRS